MNVIRFDAVQFFRRAGERRVVFRDRAPHVRVQRDRRNAYVRFFPPVPIGLNVRALLALVSHRDRAGTVARDGQDVDRFHGLIQCMKITPITK